ncbi:unnamed protein product [Closterium sp. NIES-54]
MMTAVASLSFTLDSGASQCFFRDHTTITPLLAPVTVALADPTSRPAVARSLATLPCPAVPSSFLAGLYIPSFSRNLVGVEYLQDRGITVTFPLHGRTAIGTDASTRALLATFTREPHSGLFVLHTASPQVAAPGQVAASPQVAVSSQVVTGPVAVSGRVVASCSCRSLSHPRVLWHHRPERERYFLVVVDDYSMYTTVFPLAKKSKVTSTLIRWLLATEGTRGSRVCCLHSDRGGEFRFGVLAGFCGEQGIRQSCTLPESPQQNGAAEHRIGLVIDIARTSMIHARAPHFLWPYALRYGAHQLNLQPHVSQPEGCLALVRDTSADKLSARAITCVFLGFPMGSPDYSFHHPPLHQFLDSHDVRFDESVSYYNRYPCRGLPVPPSPLFLAPSLPLAPAPPVPPPPPGPTPSGATTGGTRSWGARSRGARAGGASAGGASSGDAGAGGSGTRGASFGGTRAGGAGTGGASSWGAGAPGAGTGGARGLLELEVLVLRRRELEARPLRVPTATTPSPTAYGPTFRPPDSTPAVFSPPHSWSSPSVVPHDWTSRCPPRARPSSPLADLRTVLFRSLPRRSPRVSVLSSPPESSLIVSSHPITDYYRASRPVVSRVLASLVTDPRASPSSVSDLTAAVADFASTRRLDYATRVMAAPPPHPVSIGGESALGCDILEDMQFELQFLAAASPSLCAMLLSLEGDPDALDILTPRTYRTYVNAVLPPSANVVDGMWLFKVKRLPGSPPVFKARYVARDFNQSQRDYELHSLEFSTAFLQGRLHEEICLRRPPGFTDTFPPWTQWSLRRPVYGLRQLPREWHDTLCSMLRDLGFRPSSADPSLFVRTGSTPFFILVYVDDLVFATADRASLTEVKSELQKRHRCTDLGELQCNLGLQITRDRGARTITLTQSHMVHQVLRRFGFQFSTTQPTPLAVDHRLTGPFPDEPFESSGPYAELVGCLMYLMTCTRPDLAFPLSFLFFFVATGRHRPVQWTAAVRVAKYLATISGMGLVLGGTQPVVLTGHCDSSYADDVETQRSNQGYCFSLGAGAVSWRSTRSSSIASSSVEAEIYASAIAAQELRWLTFLLADLGERPRSAPTLYTDNKAMILLC